MSAESSEQMGFRGQRFTHPIGFAGLTTACPELENVHRLGLSFDFILF
jgi:hypothetical protein